jgi:mRNA interferase RelE/StbE
VSYAVRILPRAEKELSALEKVFYESLKKKISELADNPRPPGSRKLQDIPGWRLRVGNYRVVYEIDDSGKIVTILKVAHRKDVYR